MCVHIYGNIYMDMDMEKERNKAVGDERNIKKLEVKDRCETNKI